MSAGERAGKKAAQTSEQCMEEVASSAENGETEGSVIRLYDLWISKLARRFSPDVDDLIQVGRLELLRAHRMWQGRPHNAAFWTYARKAVIGEMISLSTRESSRAIREEEAGLYPSPTCSPDVALEAAENVSALPRREATIIAMFVAGYDASEIAERHGISRSRVYQLLEGSVDYLRSRA